MLDYEIIHALDLTRTQINIWHKLQQSYAYLLNPYLTPEYCRVADRIFGNIEVAIIKRRQEIVAFFPFQREKTHLGHAITAPLSDLQGIIAAPDIEISTKELLQHCNLKCWTFDHLITQQRLFEKHHAFVEDSPFMDLSQGFDSYCQAIKRKGSSVVSQGQRKARKLVREHGPLKLLLHDTDPASFEALVQWKSEQLVGQNFKNIFESSATVRLFKEISNTQQEMLSGLLTTLYAGDQLVAVHLGMQTCGVLSSWIPSYNPNYANYSPGLILFLEMAKNTAEKGIHKIEMGRGVNQLKLSLASANDKVAIGTIERRIVHRMKNQLHYSLRQFVHKSILSGAPLETYRKLKNSLL